jgi:hypothetical protein
MALQQQSLNLRRCRQQAPYPYVCSMTLPPCIFDAQCVKMGLAHTRGPLMPRQLSLAVQPLTAATIAQHFTRTQEFARSELPSRIRLHRRNTLPQLKVLLKHAGNPARGSTHRDSLHQCGYLLRSIILAQRRMIPVTRHMGALTQTLLQVALVLPKKGSASLAMQEFARSVPAITHPCEVVTLRAGDSHMKFCCPLRTRKPLQPHRNCPIAAP